MSTAASVLVENAPTILGVLVGLIGGGLLFLPDFTKNRWRKRFRQQAASAITGPGLTYSELQHIAERWSQDRKSVQSALRILLAAALSAEDKGLLQHVDRISDLLKNHEAREPYAELPENISLQLAALTVITQEKPDTVPQLASSLSALYSTNQRELVKQKKLSLWGFIVGVLGVLLSVPSLYLAFAGSH